MHCHENASVRLAYLLLNLTTIVKIWNSSAVIKALFSQCVLYAVRMYCVDLSWDSVLNHQSMYSIENFISFPMILFLLRYLKKYQSYGRLCNASRHFPPLSWSTATELDTDWSLRHQNKGHGVIAPVGTAVESTHLKNLHHFLFKVNRD